jgi:MoaA/NifB/PqqE/SkfB family radical SAM enzyme
MNPPRLDGITFFTTYECNSRCINCLIWKNPKPEGEKNELDAEALEKLFSDPMFAACPSIGLAGGEPTVSPFFWRLLECLPEDKRITITTNALATRRLVSYLTQAENRERYLIQVSLDGVDEVNDKVRGVKGSYRKTITLLSRLQELGVSRLVSFTINRLNYHQVKDCYELARAYGAEFNTRMAYCGGAYANKNNRAVYAFNQQELETLQRSLTEIIKAEMERPSHLPEKVVFLDKITDYHLGLQRDLPCFALQSGLVIDCYGDVFPNCPVLMTPLGSIRAQGLGAIWSSTQANQVRESVRTLKCGGCWNDCQVITNIARSKGFLDQEYGRIKRVCLQGGEMPSCIDFNSEDSSLLLGGWYELQGDLPHRYRWTEQRFSLLLPPGTSALEICGMIPPFDTTELPVTLELTTEESFLGSMRFDDATWRTHLVPLSRPTTALTKATFLLSHSYCPRDRGIGEDARKLGLAVSRISFL